MNEDDELSTIDLNVNPFLSEEHLDAPKPPDRVEDNKGSTVRDKSAADAHPASSTTHDDEDELTDAESPPHLTATKPSHEDGET